jgi:hypothetical protein
MTELTDRVEAACYGELPPTGADVEAIAENVREADRELGG